MRHFVETVRVAASKDGRMKADRNLISRISEHLLSVDWSTAAHCRLAFGQDSRRSRCSDLMEDDEEPIPVASSSKGKRKTPE